MSHTLPTAGLKRSRSAISSEQTCLLEQDAPKLIAENVAEERISYGVLVSVFRELKALPHVPMDPASTLRDFLVNDLIQLDMLKDAVEKVRRTKDDFMSRRFSSNSEFLDGVDDVNGIPVPDWCGVCGVLRTMCYNPDEHFGPQGESPPYRKCELCRFNAWNHRTSARELKFHVAKEHAVKGE